MTFLVRVRNLTAEGIKPIAERLVQPNRYSYLLPIQYSLIPSLRLKFMAWKIPDGYTRLKANGRWISKQVYVLQDIWVYVIAYDNKEKALYYGSWTASLDPYYNQTVNVIIRVKRYSSTQITATKYQA